MTPRTTRRCYPAAGRLNRRRRSSGEALVAPLGATVDEPADPEQDTQQQDECAEEAPCKPGPAENQPHEHQPDHEGYHAPEQSRPELPSHADSFRDLATNVRRPGAAGLAPPRGAWAEGPGARSVW